MQLASRCKWSDENLTNRTSGTTHGTAKKEIELAISAQI